jgi:hypothetical protein
VFVKSFINYLIHITDTMPALQGDISVQSLRESLIDEQNKKYNGKPPSIRGSASSASLRQFPIEEKKRGLTLNKNSVVRVERRIRKTMLKHDLAANYYIARQFYFFTIPQALFALGASILAFYGASELVTDPLENSKISLLVGSMSATAVFLQTMSETCNYSSLAAMHGGVAIEMSDLREELGFLKDKLDLQEDLGADDAESAVPSDGEEDDDKRRYDFEEIQSRVNHSLMLCKSPIPLPISDAFFGVESNLKIELSQGRIHELEHSGSTFALFWDHINMRLFDVLASEISNFIFFPLFLPSSKKVERRTFDVVKKMETKGEIPKVRRFKDTVFHVMENMKTKVTIPKDNFAIVNEDSPLMV